VRGYVGLLGEKRRELGDKANKLKGGLEKLSETSEQVGGNGSTNHSNHQQLLECPWCNTGLAVCCGGRMIITCLQ
jgi:hypothetical protein